MPRECVPNRRSLVRHKARIDNQKLYIEFGEYPDGRLAEIWLTAALCGTFLRGQMDALAKAHSLLLQSGVSPADVALLMRGDNFPPCGEVEGVDGITRASSVPDLIAQLIERWYCGAAPPVPVVVPMPEKIAGYTSTGLGA